MNPNDEPEPMPSEGTNSPRDQPPDPVERQQAVERTQPAQEERRAETGLNAAQRTEWIARHVTRVLRVAAAMTRTEARKELCANLFSDLVGEVQDAETNENQHEKRENGRKNILCFYEMLAPYYETLDTTDVDELLQCFHKLWSSPHIPSIFTLLLHRWLFSDRVDQSQLLKYANVVVDGAKPLRRWDVLRGETRFKPVFLYLTYEVTLSPKKVQAITEDVRKVLVRYVVQSFLFYETRQRLPNLLERLPGVIKGINALELFMLENSRELEQISVESALLRYLEGLEIMATLPQWNVVAKVSKARLQSTIHSLTSPGGPRYPPRSVRHAAIHTLDVLYPQGRHARRMVIYLSRLMHPLFWPQSVAHHLGHWLGVAWLWAMLQQACSKAKERLRLRRD